MPPFTRSRRKVIIPSQLVSVDFQCLGLWPTKEPPLLLTPALNECAGGILGLTANVSDLTAALNAILQINQLEFFFKHAASDI